VAPPPPAQFTASQIAARADEYLDAGSEPEPDVERFMGQWSLPIENYYGQPNVTEAELRAKTLKWFGSARSISLRRVGDVSYQERGDEVDARFRYHFEITANDGTVRCGVNQLAVTFEARADLPIRRISEETGPKGC
jgi:hypothetical protein